MTEKIFLTWDDVYQRIEKLPPGKCFGIPRGGAIAAGLTRRAVLDPSEADFILDDIIDTGKTADRFSKAWHRPVHALVNKLNGDPKVWHVFPWEHRDATADLEDTVLRQLEFIGEDPTREGLRETPKRVIKALAEMTQGYKDNPAEILSKVFTQPCDEMVVLRDIEFWSLCEHHLLPFHGKAHIGYIPDGKVVGISKLARLVNCFSRRLQVQERLTQEIAGAIQTHLKPLGVGVILRATHLCMACRGVRTPADMVTSALYGAVRESARLEFLRLANGSPY